MAEALVLRSVGHAAAAVGGTMGPLLDEAPHLHGKLQAWQHGRRTHAHHELPAGLKTPNLRSRPGSGQLTQSSQPG
jgi:hypothetical protein